MALGKCCFVFMLLFLCDSYGAEPCTFPEFLQSVEGDTAYPWSASSPDRVYQFTGPTMTEASIEWGLITDDKTLYTCKKKVNDNDYMISNDTSHDQCIRFAQLTGNVVRVSYAKTNTDASCNDVVWQVQDSVLVRLGTPTTVPSSGCGLDGGFLFRSDDVTHPHVTKAACGHPLPGRLESECLPGEGLRITYPDSQCLPTGAGWTTDQRLTCLGSWNEGDYTFTLLGGDSTDQVECMRIGKDVLSLEVFSGTVCPAAAIENGTQYTNFTMEAKRPDFSVCEDEYPECTPQFCTKYAEYCRKSCDKQCDAKPPTCYFDDGVVTGEKWFDAASNHTVDISQTEMVFAENIYPNLTCRQKADPASYILQPKLQKTCRPRYTCGKFTRLSPPILRYKLSQSLFEVTSDITACGEEQFSDDPAPIGDTYRSRLYKNLIATNRDLLNQTSTCALKGNFSISGLIKEKQCNGNVSALIGCEASESMYLQTNCSFDGVMNCLGEIPSDSFETKMMIVLPPNDGAKCWVIKGDQRATVSITSLYPAQCNENTPTKIQLDPNYHMTGRFDAEREDACDGIPSTSSTTAAPTTASTTSGETTTSSSESTVTTTHPNGTSVEPDTSPTTTSVTETTTEANSTQTTTGPPVTTPAPGMSGGTIAAIVICVLILAAVLAAVLYYLYKKWHRRRVPYNSLT